MEMSYSLWLLPEREWRDRLGRTIGELSLRFGTPAFSPHATVQGDIDEPLEKLREGIRPLLRGGSPLALDVESVEVSSDFFRSLYLRFRDARSFDWLREFSTRRLGTERGLSPFPHLSLAYGELVDGGDKRDLAEALSAELSGETILFTGLALAWSASTLPISDWDVLEESPLGETP